MPTAALGTGAALNRVNAACSALRHWLARFRGVSTRRLANYLAWYQWTLDARGTDSPSDLLADQAGLPAALTSRRAYASTPYPFRPELDAFTSTVG